ncbi:LacI family DNA-binding transcriptional regulator [Paenibacillus abyssi]|uniref:Catabolite control protein A n=2 Tax=Paenibacillus abyssi TaxID=1340531 RepID=A0A917CUC7_9BACL|nr:LacI family DNA-binding transcriptional regulator [Paenibacillus abyssi]GGF96348.1 catabolite control protein A [Paenibacillus abyssi]
MTVTIKDIAQQAGVSFSTVSKALRNSPLVQESTKRKILLLAEEMGYRPNTAAQRLVSKKSWAIGVVWPSVERVTPSILITLINEELEKYNYTTLLSMNKIESAIDVFNRFQPDAILIFYDRDQSFIEQMPYQTNIPILYYGISGLTPYPTIDVLRGKAIRLAVKHLTGLGHRRIAYLGDMAHSDLLQKEKIAAYEEEMKSLDLLPGIVPIQSMESHDGYVAAIKLLASGKRPTAIISGSYDLTRGIIRAAAELKLDIPKQLSIVSYDHIPQMAELELPITTVGVEVAEIARRTAELLVQLASKEPDAGIDDHIRLEPVLTERASTCRADEGDMGSET